MLNRLPAGLQAAILQPGFLERSFQESLNARANMMARLRRRSANYIMQAQDERDSICARRECDSVPGLHTVRECPNRVASNTREISVPSLQTAVRVIEEDIEQMGPRFLQALGSRIADKFSYSVHSNPRDPLTPITVELKNYPSNGVLIKIRRHIANEFLAGIETSQGMRQYTYVLLETMMQQLRVELIELGLRAMYGEPLIITREETFGASN